MLSSLKSDRCGSLPSEPQKKPQRVSSKPKRYGTRVLPVKLSARAHVVHDALTHLHTDTWHRPTSALQEGAAHVSVRTLLICSARTALCKWPAYMRDGEFNMKFEISP